MLRARDWRVKYTPDDGDLIRIFYVPALERATRYDRLTGYFRASALALAARGIEGLVRSGGRMRMLVGNTLEKPEIEAILRGEQLRDAAQAHFERLPPLQPTDQAAVDALELLAWMVAHDHLEVRIGVPVDGDKPVGDNGIFHEKSGIIEDLAGDRISWTGSLNETASGWRVNWESINVATSWDDPRRVESEEDSFRRLWHNRSPRVRVLDLPGAGLEQLLKYCPATTTLPRRLTGINARDRRRVWSFIQRAPAIVSGGDQVGQETAPVTPWPHQTRAFGRLYDEWPPRLLIADEVGLGKTIQAGLLLRQAWLSGRAKRILIGVPAAVRRQWQIELYEKFNLDWPVYDQGKLHWHAPASHDAGRTRAVTGTRWHEEPFVIASSQLMRTKQTARALVDDALPWDLIVLDEAHHARRRGQRATNLLLRLMRALKSRTQGLVLLTATPLQVHPVELWDLLDLLGLPPQWDQRTFVKFFENAQTDDVSLRTFENMARLFQVAEALGHPARPADPALAGLSRLAAKNVLSALRDPHETPRRQLPPDRRAAAVRLMRAHTPVRHLVSRHTRATLRRYHQEGLIDTRIAQRRVEDRFLRMTDRERELYTQVEHYISATYSRATGKARNPVGFIMTLYRRRLASSVHALITTLQRRLEEVEGRRPTAQRDTWHEDQSDDELSEQALKMDRKAMELAERSAIDAEDAAEIRSLLATARALPPDSKLAELRCLLAELGEPGAEPRQVMVFTQYTDTIDVIRDDLLAQGTHRLMCFSGRGGEVADAQGGWRRIDRDEVKRRFSNREADVLLCTEAAAEGLNFQFCGALINYDMPWNPMRVEQRIGRIDRLGQAHKHIDVVNLHYRDTVEADIYRILGDRIRLFHGVVGQLPPILAKVSGVISGAVLEGNSNDAGRRAETLASIERQVQDEPAPGLDIEGAVDTAISMPTGDPSPVTMEDLDRVINTPGLLPDGQTVRSLSPREYALHDPGSGEEVRVTTSAEYFEANTGSVGLWSPGHRLFPMHEDGPTEGADGHATLSALLDEILASS